MPQSREGVTKSTKGEFAKLQANEVIILLTLIISQQVPRINFVWTVHRFNALRELIPHKDKMDKATFLQQAVDYIRQLQVIL